MIYSIIIKRIITQENHSFDKYISFTIMENSSNWWRYMECINHHKYYKYLTLKWLFGLSLINLTP